MGYRVSSVQATQFRIWATRVLKDFITKGFVLDDTRLKEGSRFGKDFFDELLERIREIRASERQFYQKITDIFEQRSIDYQSQGAETRLFFARVQNKLHWAITGKTGAEIIDERASPTQPNTALTNWKNQPNGKIIKSDTTTAKNYLTEDEIRQLNRPVSMHLDFAELQATRQIPVRMSEWNERLDEFLQFNRHDVL